MDWIPIAWIVAGIVLILLEFVIPGLIVIFFGVGAIVTGLALLGGLPPNNGIPFFVFSGTSILSLVALRHRFTKIFRGSAIEGTDDAQAYGDDIVGQDAKVINWAEGTGKIELRGTTWNARADEALAVGDHVRVVGRQGLHLKIEKR